MWHNMIVYLQKSANTIRSLKFDGIKTIVKNKKKLAEKAANRVTFFKVVQPGILAIGYHDSKVELYNMQLQIVGEVNFKTPASLKSFKGDATLRKAFASLSPSGAFLYIADNE